MWLDSALSLSVRELDRKIEGERDVAGVKVRAWLTQDQAAVFDYAVEVCRRVAGADIDIGRCLEFMAGELIATYAHLGPKQEYSECAGDDPGDDAEQPILSDEESAAVEQRICPEGDEMPWPNRPGLRQDLEWSVGERRLPVSISGLCCPRAVARSSHQVPESQRPKEPCRKQLTTEFDLSLRFSSPNDPRGNDWGEGPSADGARMAPAGVDGESTAAQPVLANVCQRRICVEK